MTKRMLIDASHAEETRVVVLDGNRLEDFDVETSTKKQLKGNIYLAKVVRVEPSLQAAFVEYGGNRHGFLAFGEIHPDYYQIPVADRQRLIEQQAEEAREAEEEEDRAALASSADGEAELEQPTEADSDEQPAEPEAAEPAGDLQSALPLLIDTDVVREPVEATAEAEAADQMPAPVAEPPVEPVVQEEPSAEPVADTATEVAADVVAASADGEVLVEPEVASDATTELAYEGEIIEEPPPPETVGGESDGGEDRERRIPPRFLRNYKIQEVIRRRQILLVQVVKEERGTKGAALTTYLSLAGRFCVLMPNSPRGGGISRKITSATDRRRLKEIMAELEIPHGMGLIVRTAGANRPKPEIRRDCEYLLRLWDDIREHTLKSVAPALIYEEASLIKRAIRDVYSRDIDEIQVDGDDGWRAAHEFMRMLMPSHAKKVQLWRDGGQPLFAKYAVEAQLDSMLQPTAQLRSGGYLVINQAEALVAIDVNSGRSTRERGIEETALRTNLEAADEVARQLRLRDLAGLIVIDFIDMESRKHNAMVERRLKEALKNDRARIQVGSISHFGLMEMSRQRLRPSLAETSFIACPHCGGTGHVRSTESAAIHVLRGIEEEGAKRRAAEIVVHVATQIAFYVLNHKRDRLSEIETRYAMHVSFAGDDAQITPQFRIERVRAQTVTEIPVAITQASVAPALPEPEVEEEEAAAEAEEFEEAEDTSDLERADGVDVPVAGETSEEAERRRRRRRRRRRGGRREDNGPSTGAEPEVASAEAVAPVVAVEPDAAEVAETYIEGVPEHAEAVAEDDQRARRRGRRGGRRRRPELADGEMPPHAAPGADQPELPPVYLGPTPANPFGGHAFDIFDVMEQVEQNAAAMPAASVPAEMPPYAPPAAEPEVAVLAAPVAELEITASPEPEPALPVPNVEPELALAEPVAQEPPSQPVAANDVAPEPLVKPIVIGVDEVPVVEKKRGWWRR
jgi:ribonuclease E